MKENKPMSKLQSPDQPSPPFWRRPGPFRAVRFAVVVVSLLLYVVQLAHTMTHWSL